MKVPTVRIPDVTKKKARGEKIAVLTAIRNAATAYADDVRTGTFPPASERLVNMGV